MRCPYCKGTGKSNMWINGGNVPCYACKGTGDMEVTNEQWLCLLSTEEKAEWILDVSDECFDCGKSDNGDCPFGKVGVCTCVNKDSVVEWLKQPHTNE